MTADNNPVQDLQQARLARKDIQGVPYYAEKRYEKALRHGLGDLIPDLYRKFYRIGAVGVENGKVIILGETWSRMHFGELVYSPAAEKTNSNKFRYAAFRYIEPDDSMRRLGYFLSFGVTAIFEFLAGNYGENRKKSQEYNEKAKKFREQEKDLPVLLNTLMPLAETG